eukprot:scaffold19437_cov66-Phaeocystis_antarctica.AAC.2
MDLISAVSASTPAAVKTLASGIYAKHRACLPGADACALFGPNTGCASFKRARCCAAPCARVFS